MFFDVSNIYSYFILERRGEMKQREVGRRCEEVGRGKFKKEKERVVPEFQ